MVGYRVSLIALAIFSALVSPMSFAKSVTLKTITVNQPTPYGTLYAQIHFDERDLDVALKVEKIIKTDLIKVVNYFEYVPKNTVHFNIDPYLRLTNGNARTFPTNIINLYKFPASNTEHLIVFDDWLRGLVFHEYTHITHLDQTRGTIEGGRRIFGNIVKLLPSDVPRWFTEGIAVWSESHLMSGDGRLQNPLFRKELLVQFLNQDFCSTVDCLDEPGVYPNGQLAYWAGSHFMEYIESKKPGAIKCLVVMNSSNFPFQLNSVFEQCTGNALQNNFNNFRSELIGKQPAVPASTEAWGAAVNNAFGSNDLQKGVILDGHTLYKVEKNREREALVSYDLQDNVNMVNQFHYRISELEGITTVPALDNETKYLIVGFNEDPFFRDDNRKWKLINAETLLAEAELPFKNDPTYVVGLGNNRFLTASFIDNKWRVEKQRVDLASKSVEVELVKQFTSKVNLTYFKKIGQKILLKIHQEDEVTSLVVSDVTLEKFYSVYSSKSYYDIPVLTEKFMVVREKEMSSLLEFNEDLKNVTKSKLDPARLNRIASIEINDGRMLVLGNELKSKEMLLKESFADLKKGSTESVSTNLVAMNLHEETPIPTNIDLASFPKLYHLRPYYWFLATGSSDELFSIGATTTFSDPMDINTINATVLVYPAESKVGGNFDFIHKFTSVSDLWSGSGFFNHEYSKTDFSSLVNETTEGSLGTNYAILLKRWSLVPGLYVGASKTTDFISQRTTKQGGVSLAAQYQAQSFDDHFQNLALQARLQNDAPDIGSSYMNLQSKLQTEVRFQERLIGGLKTSYGKLYKSGFTQGVLYAGGASGIGVSRWHEFYGLPYSNAYGNEIFTARFYLDYNIAYVYKGRGLFPVFLKEVHLRAGRDTLSADRIILDKRVYRNETIHSFFIGPRFSTNLIYFMPADIDFVFSSIKKPNGGNVNQIEVGINADLF